MFDGDAGSSLLVIIDVSLTRSTDYICNYDGFENVVNHLQTKTTTGIADRAWEKYKVQGQVAGQYKTSGNGKFSYLRVYGAGHEVPAYTYGLSPLVSPVRKSPNAETAVL
jgi:carboxypeptidase C (cathepsin A)